MADSGIDQYAVLGISRHASTKEINIAWKKFALRYHPDKCGDTNDHSLEEFRKGQEAIEILRDPELRQNLDKNLSEQDQANKSQHSKWSHRGYRQFRKNQSLYSDDDWGNWKGFDAWRENENRRWSTRNLYKQDLGTDCYDDQMESSSHNSQKGYDNFSEETSQLENRYPDYDSEGQRARAEIRREGMKARVMRDEEEMKYEDENEIDQNLEFSHNDEANEIDQSTEYESVTTCFHGGIDYICHSFDAFASPHGDSTVDSGGLDLETQTDGGKSVYFDCNETQQSVSNDGRGFSNCTSIEPFTSEIEDTDDKSYHRRIKDILHFFIPYFDAKLNDPCGRYTSDDMFKEISGIYIESFYGWMENLRLSIPGARPVTPPESPSLCLHLGYWLKGFGYPECEKCHCWAPLYILTCPGCGAGACVQCRFSNDGRNG
ncbi:Heat shock protein DnaJ N-terminal [Penicillium macrosclerotiorum]|uniref:Heat shock protein DnaJ N-terminal n=1 Tax=Penicillium macrosclerotiorum TaxID=303699 RepID=UPI0025470BA2|nr:Heat shock protein DnaJ N-terminal [Penicillium macrosclerotiorum]KAJ5688628.1 Heat shock protein DnaJ N-terminal [Penicillium macrosclerotiorum]